MNAREIALQLIGRIEQGGAYSNLAVRGGLDTSGLDNKDKALVTRLVYGVTQYKLRLDYIIARFSKIKPKKMSNQVLNILRMAIYQMAFLDKIPVSAAVNESVNIARKREGSKTAGFINAVLRAAAKGIDTVKYPDKNSDTEQYLSVYYSYPIWLVKSHLAEYGFDTTCELLEAGNGIPPSAIRVNTLKTTMQDLTDILNKEGINAVEGQLSPDSLILEQGMDITTLESFKNGLFQPQDEASMLSAVILNPKPNSTVIDVCAAPGGKTFCMAGLMQNRGSITALDIHPHKLKLIEDGAKRLGIEIIKTACWDAAQPNPKLIESADYVLVDVPCSGLGIVRRKPEIKWQRTVEDINSLSMLQFNILLAASKYVKVGGELVYSTCTLTKAENEDIIKRFLEAEKGFETCEFSNNVPIELKDSAQKGIINIKTGYKNADGFFICKLKRRF